MRTVVNKSIFKLLIFAAMGWMGCAKSEIPRASEVGEIPDYTQHEVSRSANGNEILDYSQIEEGEKFVGGDKFEDVTPNPVKKVSEEPVSTFSVDVDTSSYAFMRRSLNNGLLPQKDAVRIEELINYFDYDYPLPKSGEHPFKPSVVVYPTPWNKHTKLLLIGIKGYDIIPAEKPKSNLVFLLDVSGSMESPDKLPLLKNAFRLMVENLQPEDTYLL